MEFLGDDRWKGRYRITGVRKHKLYAGLVAGGPPYLNCNNLDNRRHSRIGSRHGRIALERGVAVRGKLLDKVTGKPIPGQVRVRSGLPDNPNLKDFTDINKLGSDSNPGKTKADGSFTVIAIPGPGWLARRRGG